MAAMKQALRKQEKPEEKELKSMEINKDTGRTELSMDELEMVNAGSWLGKIWNKIKSFGGDSGCTDCIDNQ